VQITLEIEVIPDKRGAAVTDIDAIHNTLEDRLYGRESASLTFLRQELAESGLAAHLPPGATTSLTLTFAQEFVANNRDSYLLTISDEIITRGEFVRRLSSAMDAATRDPI
jgi:hypothetical protein